ncbi:MAG: M48 family metalloprotease, partial [Gammaproteobacteria bacterium]
GLLAYLNSEAELAAVLGHEIAHVTARHGVRQQTASTAAGLGYTIASILVPELGHSQAQNAYGLLSNALLSGYGREHELEADRLGAEYLARTGRDPQAMLGVIGVLKNQDQFARQQAAAEGRDHQGYHGLFATHPRNDTRLQQVIGAASGIAVTHSVGDRRREYLQAIDGMVYGDSVEQGIRRGSNFYHPELGIALRFPDKWAIKNLPDRLIAIAPGGAASIQMQVDDINRRIPPREFMKQRLGIKDLQQGRPLAGDDQQGYTGLTRLNTAEGPRLGRVSVVYLNQQAYIFVGVAVDERVAPQTDPLLLATARSLHPLTNKERQLAKPLRIRITRAAAGHNYARLASSSLIDSYAEQHLRLLNNHYPTGVPTPNSLIKIVE